MSKCENCIHNPVCAIACIQYEGGIDCKKFKDKSLCVELPYKIGQLVYVLRSQTGDGKNLYLRAERIFYYKVFFNVVFMCFASGRLSIESNLWETRVFLDRAEAERKLSEVGE